MVKLLRNIRSYILYKRCKRAIKRADQRAISTGKKQLVLMYNGRPIVVSKQHLRYNIRNKKFAKGFTAAKAEELAIYKTR